MKRQTTSVAFIGFGEAAQAFLSGWGEGGPVVAHAYDIKIGSDGAASAAKAADYRTAGVTGHPTPGGAIRAGELVISVVTAEQAYDAADAAGRAGLGGRLYLDFNSCAPETKARAAAVVEGGGGRYVDVAVMAPVHPGRQRTPLLFSGPHAPAAARILDRLGMNASEAPGPVGTAAAIKLCRSIMVKGLEALIAEMLAPARRLGVEDSVLASLDASHPGFGWRTAAPNAIGRMALHGRRRAEEMREAAAMVAGMDLPASMIGATASWQQRLGDAGVPPGAGPNEAAAVLDGLGNPAPAAPEPTGGSQ